MKKKTNPKVSIIIVHFNGFSVLKNCLDSLKTIKGVSFEVIVVDNSSKDDSVADLKKYKSQYPLNIIESKSNLGFAGGNNLGVTEAKSEYILLLNNDTTVTPNLLEVLVSKMETDTSIGAMQPKIKLMDNPKLLDNAGAFLNRLGLTVHWGFGETDSKEFDNEAEIFSAKGACLITRSSIIKKIGLSDDNFGSYYEESDFCHRVWLSGYKVIYYPKTFIYHKVGFTSSQMDPVKITLVSTRNKIFSLFKNLDGLNLFTILLPHIAFLKLLGIYYLFKLQFGKAWMIYGAIFWNIMHFPLLIKGRIATQKLRVKKDSEIMPVILRPIDVKSLFSHFKKIEKNFK